MQRIRVASARRWLTLSDRVEGVLPGRRLADWDRMSEGETSDVLRLSHGIGLYAVIAGHRVGPRGRVYALKPTPATFQLLRANARLNGFTWVECVNVGLSDRAEIRDSGFLVVEPPGRTYPYVNLIAAKLPRRSEPFFSTLGVSPLQLRRHLRPHPSLRS